jgi:hypothetical protein
VPIGPTVENNLIDASLNVQFKCENVPFIILEVKLQFDIEPEAFIFLFVILLLDSNILAFRNAYRYPFVLHSV